MSPLIPFISILWLLEYRSFVPLGSYIPRYFIHFNAMLMRLTYLISPSGLLLLVYRNAKDFCVLILYPATLLNSLMSASNFLVVSLGFSMYRVMSPVSSDSFTSYFSIWIPFFFFLSNRYG